MLSRNVLRISRNPSRYASGLTRKDVGMQVERALDAPPRNATPDNHALHDDAFKRIVAEAIADGIREWASAADDGRR